MNFIKIIKTALLLAVTTSVFGCGGGGGGGDTTPGTNPAGPQTLSFKIRTVGTGTVYGVQLTVGIPTGVTVKSDTGGSMVAATGNALSGYADGSVSSNLFTIAVTKATGFATGEFATFYVSVPAGQTVTAASFTPVTLIMASDAGGAPISGISVELF